VSSEWFDSAIINLKADNISGSEEIVRKAIQIIKQQISYNPKKYTSINDLITMLREIIKIKKEMAALRNVLIYFIDFFQLGVRVEDIADRVLEKLDNQRESLSDKLVPLLAKSKTIMTHSRSSTFVYSLFKLLDFKKREELPELVIFESRPALEGKKLALEASKAGFKVNYLVDAAMGLAMKTFKPDIVLIGADVIFPNGNVANKIGCHTLAMFAYQYQVPMYVASTTLKLLLKAIQFAIQSYKSTEVWLKNIPDGVKIFNPYFEMIPANLIHSFITEFGISDNIPDVKLEIEKEYIHKLYE
jgi:translation initiation factor 2B subunit (eIF-2B alpha/beta/delta family)